MEFAAMPKFTMMQPDKILLLAIVFISLETLGQTGQLAGKVVDAATQEPLPFAHVFVNNTTLGTSTDANGNFIIRSVPIGTTEIIYSFVGYQTLQRRVTITEGATTSVDIQLTMGQHELADVEVNSTRDKEWTKQLKQFKKLFLGHNKAGSLCKIQNPWVIDFVNDENTKAFTATASAPIEIANTYLGYFVLFHLKSFHSNGVTYSIEGNAYFKEMTDSTKIRTWKQNREMAYSGSDRHMLKSILDNNVSNEGFRLYVNKPGAIEVNTRSDMFYREVGGKVVEYDTRKSVTPGSRPYEYLIQMNGRTEVHYLNKTGVTRYYKDMTGPVSWIEVRGNQLRVNNNGVVLNPGDVVYSGEMSDNRVGAMLPLDYQPETTASLSAKIQSRHLPLEKIYFHTDKPYYYPGEIIWMKGYMNYSQPALSDSLSKVLYVELINEAKEVVLTKTLKIDSGLAATEFLLSPALPAGNYLLRSYTNWMRNFGEQCFFLKPISVLNLNEKPGADVLFSPQTDSTVQILSDKESYGPHGKIQLTIHVRDENNLPVAGNLSISVTDENQVARITEATSILTEFTLPDLPRPAQFLYPVEQGIVLSGSFKNDKQKPEQAMLMTVVGKFEDLLMVETDERGKFSLNGLQLYDSTEFAFQAKDKRGKPYGKVQLTTREIPSISSWKWKKPVIVSEAMPQRLLSEFESPKDATLLKQVVVTAARIEAPPSETQHKIFGMPDHVVTSERLVNSGTTILPIALQGKVPGLIITAVTGQDGVLHYSFRIRGTSSILLNKEPLVLVDGIPAGGTPFSFDEENDTAGDRMMMVDVSTIDRIEVTTHVNVLYGEAGRNGVISIFTKAGATNRLDNLQSQKAVDVFKIAGFSPSGSFKMPTYDDLTIPKDTRDYRSTIYWNPNLKTDDLSGSCAVSFFAADLPGRYRVVVEGVSKEGKPLRSESLITIGSN
jgi:hypothetical protein